MTGPVESGGVALVVEREDEGVRLDIFLARTTGLGRRAAARMMARCRVNGRRVPKSLLLRCGDRVEVGADPAMDSSDFAPPRLLAEESDFLGLAKPAGLPSVALVGGEGPSVARWLAKHFPECAACGGTGESGLVHRLDSGTSGVLIAARTQNAYSMFRAGFAEHRMKKIYHCLVEGDLDTALEIDLPIGQHRKSRTRVRALTSGDARRYRSTPAETAIRPLERFGSHTLIEATTRSGARHQIRIHLAASGHPLAGDSRYGASGRIPGQEFLLHAQSIEWTDHGGDPKSLGAPIPEAFARQLDELRATSPGTA